jgi:hypothetical protein
MSKNQKRLIENYDPKVPPSGVSSKYHNKVPIKANQFLPEISATNNGSATTSSSVRDRDMNTQAANRSKSKALNYSSNVSNRIENNARKRSTMRVPAQNLLGQFGENEKKRQSQVMDFEGGGCVPTRSYQNVANLASRKKKY